VNKAVIYVPSYKRAMRLLTRINTLQWISPEWKKKTYLVVREEEIGSYEKVAGLYGVNLIFIPSSAYENKSFFGWGDTMDWIINYAIERNERFIIMDDDLKLSYRPELTEKKWLPMNNEHFEEGIDKLLTTTYDIPYMGWRERQYSDKHITEYEDNARFIHVFGFYSEFFKNNSKFRYRNSEQKFMTDFRMLLTLLTNGVRTRAWMRYCHDDIPDAEGGCSVMRTVEEYNQSAITLCRDFPDIVTLRQKTNWNDVRLSPTIHWKRAFKGEQ